MFISFQFFSRYVYFSLRFHLVRLSIRPPIYPPELTHSLTHSLTCVQTHHNQVFGDHQPAYKVVGLSRLDPEILDPLLDGFERLLLGRAPRGFAEDELGFEMPGGRHAVGLGQLDVDGRVVVLQIRAKTFGLQGGPESELVHCAGVFGP